MMDASLSKIKRAWSQYGIIGSVRQLVRRKCPLHVSKVYGKTDRSPSRPVEGLTIRRYGRYVDIEAETSQAFSELGGPGVLREMDKLFRLGCELWLGRLEGKVVGVCWSRRGKGRTDWFVPLTQSDATIQSCLVFPEYRGRGIYPAMLQMMVNAMMDEDDVHAVFIDCKSWNHPSIRGIVKAGFKPLGNALRLVFGDHVWILRNRCRV